MPLDADAAYQALTARDARFDGRLFVGVTSTRIYCRPICRVRTPLQKNCRFFETPAQAEAALFRPCLKCRPELAPGAGPAWTVMDASRTLARQAAAELDARAANGEAASVASVAARLGVSDRHLRRIFTAEHGVTPLQYVQTRRLLLAKHLLTDSALPVAQVALASGFQSLRRFNAAFAGGYRMSPSRLRGDARQPGAKEAPAAAASFVSVTLAYRAPYDVASLLRFIARRAIPGIEEVEARSIRRSVRAGVCGDAAGWIEATFDPVAPLVRVRFAPALGAASGRVVGAVRRWLDLDAAPDAIDAALAALPGAPGLRLPGSIDAFELAVRAVLGQQITVAAARTLANRLVQRFGTSLATPWPAVDRAFPAPGVLAHQESARIAELGIIRNRAGAIIALAQDWAAIETLLAPHARAEALIERLCALPGIGPWTAHYIAMRALGWPDAFPPNDVAVLKALQRLADRPAGNALPPDLLSVPLPADPPARKSSQCDAEARAASWQPWRSYAVLRLWNSLETAP